ncbi:chlorophyll A-B binding protein [Aureococcus anophagefferens]|nr:chlorophyll A-B binding protein [Aureococcus anophagefferens]
MPDIKRTRKGRPGPKAQRSALIVASGKSSGRDAQVQPKRESAPRPSKPSMLSVFEAGDSVEAFLERATEKEEAYETARGLEQSQRRRRPGPRGGAAARGVILAPGATAPLPKAAAGALFAPLDVPKRPAWDATTTAEVLDARERSSFVDWRRAVAALEERERKRREAARAGKRLAPSASVSTPFERNLEVWRQLWRTLERSDAVLLLVDARWPDFYANPDLIAYARSLGREVLIVAADAPTDADDAAPTPRRRRARAATTRLLGRRELRGEALARASRAARGDDKEGRPHCVGLVGYPNVGKSSCVNVLRDCDAYAHGVGARAGVSATPGKTKHLQTLLVGDDFELCDCPGLVFPALVAGGAAELICAGVVPIARMREPLAACQVVADRTPRALFDALYGTELCRQAGPLDARVLLDAVCERQDYLCAGSGAFDHNRAGREVVRAYVDGVLLHCHAPPGLAGDALAAFRADTRETATGRCSALAPSSRAKLILALAALAPAAAFVAPAAQSATVKVQETKADLEALAVKLNPVFPIHIPGDYSTKSPAELWDQMPEAGKWQIILFVGFLEFWSESGSGGAHYTKGGKPGAFPSFNSPAAGDEYKIPHPVPLDLFDPAGLSKNASPEKKERGLLIEINNGRLAMLGLFGFLAESKVPGSVPALSFIPAYDGDYMAPFAANFHVFN